MDKHSLFGMTGGLLVGALLLGLMVLADLIGG